jgi:hypothetical protein
MTNRTSTKFVTFARPFTMTELDTMQPAGTYAVETEEEIVPYLSFVAYRCIATRLTLARRPGSHILAEVATVDPVELELALARDTAAAARG